MRPLCLRGAIPTKFNVLQARQICVDATCRAFAAYRDHFAGPACRSQHGSARELRHDARTERAWPGKNGRQLADEAGRSRPALKVLFTTGYTRNAIVHHGRLDPGVDLITKPYSFEDLSRKVRAMLDRHSEK